jgi:DNA-binding NarL/FixJ family response regulator
MPILNGLDAGWELKVILPCVKLLYLTMHPDVEIAAQTFRLGAHGYLLKTCAPSEMRLAVHEVLRGKTYLSKVMSRDAVNSLRWDHKEPVNVDACLTSRERRCCNWKPKGRRVGGDGNDLLQGAAAKFRFLLSR